MSTSPEQPIGQFEDLDRVLHGDNSADGANPLSNLANSPDHGALAAIDPVFDSLLRRVAERAEAAAQLPSYRNKHAYLEADHAARDYAGPSGHRD